MMRGVRSPALTLERSGGGSTDGRAGSPVVTFGGGVDRSESLLDDVAVHDLTTSELRGHDCGQRDI